jgi:hypothetical protein
MKRIIGGPSVDKLLSLEKALVLFRTQFVGKWPRMIHNESHSGLVPTRHQRRFAFAVI